MLRGIDGGHAIVMPLEMQARGRDDADPCLQRRERGGAALLASRITFSKRPRAIVAFGDLAGNGPGPHIVIGGQPPFGRSTAAAAAVISPPPAQDLAAAGFGEHALLAGAILLRRALQIGLGHRLANQLMRPIHLLPHFPDRRYSRRVITVPDRPSGMVPKKRIRGKSSSKLGIRGFRD